MKAPRQEQPQPHHIIPLASGRRVAVDEYGDPQGAPVFFCHGWPSSRTQGALMDDTARELGLRIISPDRPGIGKSDEQPGRRLLDWPPLMRELADAFGIKRCRVLGVSGGGPYALASAWALPEVVEAAAVVCGAPPLAERVDGAGLLPIYRMLLRLHRGAPGFVRRLLRAARPLACVRLPQWSLRLLRPVLPVGEALVFSDPRTFEICFEGYRASWQGCRDAVADDGEIYVQPWSFPLGEIRVPVQVWHGTDDRNFACSFAEELAAQLPCGTLHVIAGEGHFSLPIRRAHDILATLKSAGTTAPAPCRRVLDETHA